jgi:hypothetical protein
MVAARFELARTFAHWDSESILKSNALDQLGHATNRQVAQVDRDNRHKLRKAWRDIKNSVSELSKCMTHRLTFAIQEIVQVRYDLIPSGPWVI